MHNYVDILPMVYNHFKGEVQHSVPSKNWGVKITPVVSTLLFHGVHVTPLWCQLY